MTFKRIFTWASGAVFLFYVGFLAYWLLYHGINGEMWALFMKQWLAIVLFPSACFAAFIAVLVLDQTAGNIELKAFGIEFKGAAGPLILWALLILVLATSFHLLWQA